MFWFIVLYKLKESHVNDIYKYFAISMKAVTTYKYEVIPNLMDKLLYYMRSC